MLRRSIWRKESSFLAAAIGKGRIADAEIHQLFLQQQPLSLMALQQQDSGTADDTSATPSSVIHQSLLKRFATVQSASAAALADPKQPALVPPIFGPSRPPLPGTDNLTEAMGDFSDFRAINKAVTSAGSSSVAWASPDFVVADESGLPGVRGGHLTSSHVLKCYVPPSADLPSAVIFSARNEDVDSAKSDAITLFKASAYLTPSPSFPPSHRVFQATFDASTKLEKVAEPLTPIGSSATPRDAAGRCFVQQRLDAAAATVAALAAAQRLAVGYAKSTPTFGETVMAQQPLTQKRLALMAAYEFGLESVAQYVCGRMAMPGDVTFTREAPEEEAACLTVLGASYLEESVRFAGETLGRLQRNNNNSSNESARLLKALEDGQPRLASFGGRPDVAGAMLALPLIHEARSSGASNRGASILDKLASGGEASLKAVTGRTGTFSSVHLNLATSVESVYRDVDVFAQALGRSVPPFGGKDDAFVPEAGVTRATALVASELLASACVAYRCTDTFDDGAVAEDEIARQWVMAQVFLDASHQRRQAGIDRLRMLSEQGKTIQAVVSRRPDATAVSAALPEFVVPHPLAKRLKTTA